MNMYDYVVTSETTTYNMLLCLLGWRVVVIDPHGYYNQKIYCYLELRCTTG